LAEAAIREVKKSSGRKMMESQYPKRVWDDCIELESFIKSHTAIRRSTPSNKDDRPNH
jgi:hypothetical protein